jgi:hypothetical protein
VPPWADQDPPPPDEPQPPETPDKLPDRPLAEPRRLLRDFMQTGDRNTARRALGEYARSMGGRKASASYARAARTGGNAIAGLATVARSGGAQLVVNGFDLGALAGQPLDTAIMAIVDQFCPPGILEEDMIRAAVAEALFEALGDVDLFDPTAINDHTVVVATVCFVAELVFARVAAEQGAASDGVAPEVAVRRENDLRDLVRTATDAVATPIIQREGNTIGPGRVESIVTQVAAEVYAEIERWS